MNPWRRARPGGLPSASSARRLAPSRAAIAPSPTALFAAWPTERAEFGQTRFVPVDRSGQPDDPHMQSVPHGVVVLESFRTPYGGDRRQLRVAKLRARAFRTGAHDYEIRRGGLEIFPRIVAAAHASTFARVRQPSGLDALDALLGGGPLTGTSLMVTGPAGAGKTTIAMLYAISAARRGERAAVFSFDETLATLTSRLAEIGLDTGPLAADGRLLLRQIDPVELSPGEFGHHVQVAVEHDAVRLLVIDSLNGYLNSLPDERHLVAQLHELLTYLANHGVVTLLVVGQHGLVGPDLESPVDASYLSDSILLLRYFEAGGRVRKAISVTKKRGGGHEPTVRELMIDGEGIRVGQPLSDFRGVLTGVPEYLGPAERLDPAADAHAGSVA